MIEHLLPGLVLVFGGLLAAGPRGPWRNAAVLLAPLAATALGWTAPEAVIWRAEFLGHALTPLAVDKLSRLFALVFAIAAFGGALFALNRDSRGELPAALGYPGAATYFCPRSPPRPPSTCCCGVFAAPSCSSMSVCSWCSPASSLRCSRT